MLAKHRSAQLKTALKSRGRMCGFSMLRSLTWILLWINLVTVQCSINLVDGGYEDVVVEIDGSVPAKDCSAIFRGLEVRIYF